MKIYLIIIVSNIFLINSLLNFSDDNFYIDILLKVFSSAYQNCSDSLFENTPNDTIKKSLTRYPYIIDHIGKTINDLGDEIECLKAFTKTNYVIYYTDIKFFLNAKDERFIKFLELKNFCVGACLPEKCNDTFQEILGYLMNSSSDIYTIEKYENTKEDKDYLKPFLWFIVIYLDVKLIFGIIRLIFFPKGYDKYAVKLLKDKEVIPGFEFNNDDKSENDFNKEKLILFNEDSNIDEYNPNFDFTSSFPFYLRFMRFLDLFNDIHYFFSRRNRYFNDNGLESLNFMKAIILYLIIFANTFNSLIVLPSKDILNESFFESNNIHFYLLSNVSLNYWIFLEAAYTSYKLMIFIKTQMYLYYKNKNLSFNLIFIYAKFIFLFIPKIATFIFCFYYFYYDVKKFKNLFSAEITFRYITEQVIYNNNTITCHQKPFNIFTDLLIFSNNANNFNLCFDFTFVYFNIFFCSFCSMILLYFAFLFRKKIFEIFLIIINLGLFIYLMLIVDDKKTKGKDIVYTIYHFKGQEYTIKIFHLSLLVYNLGFIFGIIYFNYNNNKNLFAKKNKILKLINENKKNVKNSKNDKKNGINLNYYPLSFFNGFLKYLHNLSFEIKFIIILICMIVMFFISVIFQYIFKKKEDYYNSTENYYKTLEENDLRKYYFLFGKHAFILIFFIINLILMTLPKKGLYKTLVKLKLNNALSKTGFTFICLYQIIVYFSFTGFLVKIKFNLTAFVLISIGNFLIVFIFCLLLDILFELPIRIIIKKILRLGKKKK